MWSVLTDSLDKLIYNRPTSPFLTEAHQAVPVFWWNHHHHGALNLLIQPVSTKLNCTALTMCCSFTGQLFCTCLTMIAYMSATNFSNTKNTIFGSKIPFFKYVTDLRLSKLTNEQGTHKIILSSSPFHPAPSSLLVHFSIFSQELWRDPQQGVDRKNWVASNSTIMSSGTVWIKKSNLHFKIYKPILPGEGWRKEEKAK